MAISVREGKRGTTYGVSVYDSATGKTVWLGTFPSLREATRAERAHDRRPKRASITVADFTDEWIATRQHLKPTTVEGYQYALSQAVEFFGDTPMQEIGPRDAEAYSAALTERLAPLTARNHFAVFSRLMRAAVRYDLIEQNPCDGASNLPKRTRKRDIVPLTREQHLELVAGVSAFWRPMIALWPLVGLRNGEMVGLKREDVTDSHLIIRRQLIRNEERAPKSGKTRTVPLTTEARAIVADQLARESCNRNGRVFTTSQGSDVRMSVMWYQQVVPVLERMGLDGITPHTMRHTYASWLIAAGVNIRQVSEALGHSNASITLNTYAHLMPRSDAEVVDRLSTYLSADSQQESR